MSSSLDDHRKQGRILKPPFRAMGNVNPVSRMTDTLPDMIWLCSVLAINDQKPGLLGCGRVLDIVDDVAGPYFADVEERDRPIFDGRLTTFEKVPDDARRAILDELERQDIYDRAVPEGFAHSLGLYPAAPGRWLITGWLRRGPSVSWEQAQSFMTDVLTGANHGQSQIATDAKAIVLRQFLKAGKISFAPGATDGISLLPRYPDGLTDEELRQARPTIRALFLGLIGTYPENDDGNAMVVWARLFWRSNWNLFPCLSDEHEVPSTNGQSSSEDVARERIESLEELRRFFMVIARRVDPDLYDPSRYEVLTGTVLRSLRLASAAANTPVLWSGELGMPVLRSMVEAQIVVKWLIKRNDAGMYSKFKDYGRGRLKLLKLHVEKYADALGDQAPPELEAYLEYLEAEVNQDIGEEWQEIRLESTFSGLSAHAMAKEVGLEREYNLQFAPASGVTHGEWTSLDRYVLQQCRNPLHRGHRVPRSEGAAAVDSRFIDLLIDVAEDLVSDYAEALAGFFHPASPMDGAQESRDAASDAQ